MLTVLAISHSMTRSQFLLGTGLLKPYATLSYSRIVTVERKSSDGRSPVALADVRGDFAGMLCLACSASIKGKWRNLARGRQRYDIGLLIQQDLMQC